jgi:DNA-binding response OmpR family regulator
MKAISSMLVIEDNPTALHTIARLLSTEVETVREAASAEEAVEFMKQEKFSFIITDYRLPGMNGVQFLEQLRAKGDNTPVIVLSGAPDKTGVVRATNCERVDFFGKPFRTDELMKAIKRLAAS